MDQENVLEQIMTQANVVEQTIGAGTVKVQITETGYVVSSLQSGMKANLLPIKLNIKKFRIIYFVRNFFETKLISTSLIFYHEILQKVNIRCFRKNQ